MVDCSKDSFLFCNQVYEAMKEQVFYGIEAYMARKKVEFNQLHPRFTYFRTRSSRADHLRTHLKTHNGEKLNKCNQCDFASSYAYSLKMHMKAHTQEKSHKCSQCDYATSNASNFKTHMKRHICNNLKRCNQCVYASPYASNLRTQWSKAK